MRIPAVDAYIARAPSYARPILRRLRALFHRACPDIQETIKWGVPAFERGGLVGLVAAFKAHCRLVLWRGAAAKVASVADVPKNAAALIRAAVDARRSGKKAAPRKPRPAPRPPKAFLDALRRRAGALARFQALRPSHRREYVEWIAEARRPETRARRVAQAVGWIAQGRTRYWQYGR
jgi:hypothetical protein